MKAISYIETPFPEKFGVPRQSLLVQATGLLRFPKNDFYSEAFRGIENFTHLWLLFEFHFVKDDSVQALIRPPRFLGKKKWGVFATRSPHRPNRLGLSVVKFEKIEFLENEILLTVSGVDLVDKTPIFDIKPYIPYVDSIPEANALGFEKAPEVVSVFWRVDCELNPSDKDLVEKVIGLDPRPGQDKDSQEEYGVTLLGWNFRFQFIEGSFQITKATKG